MIKIDIGYAEKLLAKAGEFVSLSDLAAIILASASLLTAFIVALKAQSGKQHRFGYGFIVTYILLAAAYFAFAAADSRQNRTTFKSLYGALTASVLLAAGLTAIYVCFFLAVKRGVKKKYVARIEERKETYPLERRGAAVLPLKRESAPDRYGHDVNIRAFKEILDELSRKELSFSDKEEYNRLVDESKFLTGVAATADSTAAMRETFVRCVKLGAKY